MPKRREQINFALAFLGGICSVNSYSEMSDKTDHKIDEPYSIPSSCKGSNLKKTTLFGSFKSVNGNDIPNSAWALDTEDIEKDTGRILNKHYKVETDLFKSNK